MKTLLMLLVFSVSACAQIIQVEGGTSTIYQGYGGTSTLYFSNHTTNLSAGCVSSSCGFSASDSFNYKKAKVTVGDSDFSFTGNGFGLSLRNRGVTASKGQLSGFLGQIGTHGGANLPFFKTFEVSHFGVGFGYSKLFNNWKVAGLSAIAGSQKTIVEGVSFTGNRLKFSEGAGLLNNKLFINGASSWTGERYSLFGSHQNFYYRGKGGLSDLAGVSMKYNSLNSGVSVFHSKYVGMSAMGFSLNGGLKVGPTKMRAMYMESKRNRILSASVSEKVTRHLTLTGAVNGKSPAFGFEYTSNRITVSLNQTMVFTERGFQQASMITLSLHIPQTDVQVHAGAQRMSHQPVVFTGYASDYVKGPVESTAKVAGKKQYKNTGKYVISGSVRKQDGHPVSGAALEVGQALVFTDMTGAFFVRVKKPQALPLVVKTEEFTDPGNWVIVTAPSEAVAGKEVLIVVTTK